MTKKQERHIVATVGTILFMLLIFLLLWLVRLNAVVPEQEEGVEIAFGEVEEAGGYMAEESEAVPLPAPEPTAPEQPSAPSDNDLMTQEDEEALALRKAQEEKEKARKQAEAERLQREKEEKARLEAERKAREAAEAERKAKEAEAIAKANQMGSLFGNSGNNTGSGNSQGSGQKGNPVGHGSMGGHNYSLAGRSPKSIPDPVGDYTENARVVVQIKVNAEGNVTWAKWTDKGTRNANAAIIKMAEDAARKSKWDSKPGSPEQLGTIEYNFVLK